jgi:adenine-specific DNA-methyltransferase
MQEYKFQNSLTDTFSISNRRYIGSKTKLLNFIKEQVDSEIGKVSSFLDIFSGTGVVGNHFNTSSCKVFSNDLLYSNYLTNYAFLSDESFDKKKIDEILSELNSIKTYDNYFSDAFGEKFFSYKSAKKIGSIREKIDELKSELNFREETILITSLIYAIDKIANTCGHYEAFRIDAKFKDDFSLKHLNIFHNKNSNNQIFNQDANKLIQKLDEKIDVIYADPPYNSRQYIASYHLIENLAKWQKPEVEGKASKMVDRANYNSKYCYKNAIDAFKELISNANANYFILSYSDMGDKGNDRSNARMKDSDIIDIMQTLGTLSIKEMNHQPFSTGKSKIQNHKERLFICKLY